LDSPEAEIARPEVVAESQFTGMALRSRSWGESVQGNSEITRLATRLEPEVVRPETEIAPVAGPSFGDVAVVGSRRLSVESDSEADVETQSGYPFPARQEPEITQIPLHPIGKPRSFTTLTYGNICY